ncbi:MAG: hypothetical protein N3A65_07630, partial [candidate division WOR-3 bacterium]|nr:hypothetical protein [candidate division WOR-3 bacterium]
KPQTAVLENVEKKEDSEDGVYYEVSGKQIYIEGRKIKVHKALMEFAEKKGKTKSEKEKQPLQFKNTFLEGNDKTDTEDKKGGKSRKPNIEIEEYEEEDDNFYVFI